MNISKCSVSKKCSGCQLSNMSYDEQLHFKQRRLEFLLSSFCTIEPIQGNDSSFHYRNKSQFSFKALAKKDVGFGIYQSKTQSVTVIQQCLLDAPIADSIAQTTAKLIKSFKLSPYDYHKEQGLFRHLLLRSSERTGEIMAVLVVTENFRDKQKFANALLSRHKEITTIVMNICNDNKMMLGENEEILYGDGCIHDMFMEKVFKISPKSFFQVNTKQAQKLYYTALTQGCLDKNDTVLDAYCGTGTIGILASDYVKKVIGVEINEDAVHDAIENGKINHADNVEFVCDDSGKFLRKAIKSTKFDAVIMDPPRAGCSKSFLDAIIAAAIKKLIYISCNPETLQRDLFLLQKHGYKVSFIQGFDLFPMTKHTEVVVVLTHSDFQSEI